MSLSSSKITDLRFFHIIGRTLRSMAIVSVVVGCAWSGTWASESSESAKPPSQAYVPEVVKQLKPVGYRRIGDWFAFAKQ